MKRPLKELANVAYIVAGVLSAGMGLEGFLLSSHFIDGGVTVFKSSAEVQMVDFSPSRDPNKLKLQRGGYARYTSTASYPWPSLATALPS